MWPIFHLLSDQHYSFASCRIPFHAILYKFFVFKLTECIIYGMLQRVVCHHVVELESNLHLLGRFCTPSGIFICNTE
jgi:hypothetical protein